MKTVFFTIHGDVPSKKNSRIFVAGGRGGFTIPGKYHQDWHKNASREMLALLHKTPCAVTKAQVSIVFYPLTYRKSDLTNRAESIMDLLVNCGVLVDDNWFAVKKLTLQFGGVDRKDPRAVVTLKV